MKNLKRFFLGIVILAIALLLPGCGGTQSPERDPATFDEFADSIFQLVLSGDELSSNYLFEDPTKFGLEHYEPSLPTPSSGSIIGTILINYYFDPLYSYDYNKLNDDQKKRVVSVINAYMKSNIVTQTEQIE